MPKFAVFMNQTGEGCDYMIGCGSRLDYLTAETIEEAREEAIVVASEYDDDEERALERILLVQVHSEIFRDELVKEAEEVDPVEAKERAELERLKRKYE